MNARERLRARQSEVLGAVLCGDVPDGFDPTSTRVTGLVLRAKRRQAARHALPLQAEIPRFAELFDAFALEGPPAGCAHDDARALVRWALERDLLDARTRAAWRVQQVEDGHRRFATVRTGSRLLLVVGAGSWVYDVPLWPPGRRPPHGRG